MAAIKNIRGATTAAPGKGKAVVPVVKVERNTVQVYCDAANREKEAKKDKDTVAVELKELGLQKVFEHNCQNSEQPDAQISSVLLEDTTGSQLQVTWQSKFNEVEPEQIEKGLTAILKNNPGSDVNHYVAWQLVPKFDTSIFYIDGRFSQVRFDRFKAAMEVIADELKLPNPVTFDKVLAPTDQINTVRFKELTPAENMELQKVLPNTISLKAIAKKEGS